MERTLARISTCIDRAMELWRIHGERYSTCLERYYDLLEKRRELGIKPLRRITKTVLQEYPDIPFLKIQYEHDAESYLDKLSGGELQRLVRHIEYVMECDHAYRTVAERVVEFQYQIDNYGCKTSYGVNPDFLGGRNRGRNRRLDESR